VTNGCFYVRQVVRDHGVGGVPPGLIVCRCSPRSSPGWAGAIRCWVDRGCAPAGSADHGGTPPSERTVGSGIGHRVGLCWGRVGLAGCRLRRGPCSAVRGGGFVDFGIPQCHRVPVVGSCGFDEFAVEVSSDVALQFSKSSLGQGSSAFDGVPVLGAVKVVQPWGAPS
jgi:hypothetical protein